MMFRSSVYDIYCKFKYLLVCFTQFTQTVARLCVCSCFGDPPKRAVLILQEPTVPYILLSVISDLLVITPWNGIVNI